MYISSICLLQEVFRWSGLLAPRIAQIVKSAQNQGEEPRSISSPPEIFPSCSFDSISWQLWLNFVKVLSVHFADKFSLFKGINVSWLTESYTFIISLSRIFISLSGFRSGGLPRYGQSLSGRTWPHFRRLESFLRTSL